MCFGKREDQPAAPVHTPVYAPAQANEWFHVTEEDQQGNTKVLREGIGAPPSGGSDDGVKGGGTRKSNRTNKSIRM